MRSIKILEAEMLAQIKITKQLPIVLGVAHTLVLLPKSRVLPKDLLYRDLLVSVLKRRGIRQEEFVSCGAISADTAEGAQIVWAMLDSECCPLVLRAKIKEVVALALAEQPINIALVLYGTELEQKVFSESVIYFLQIHGAGASVPWQKYRFLKKITVTGVVDEYALQGVVALSAGVLMVRYLMSLSADDFIEGVGQCLQSLMVLPYCEIWQYDQSSVVLAYNPDVVILNLDLQAITLKRSALALALMRVVADLALPVGIAVKMPIGVVDGLMLELDEPYDNGECDLRLILEDVAQCESTILLSNNSVLRRLVFGMIECSGVDAVVAAPTWLKGRALECEQDHVPELVLQGSLEGDNMSEELVLLKYLLMAQLQAGSEVG